MTDSNGFEAEDATPEGAAALSTAASFPWPPAEDAPVVESFIETWRESVFHPTRFFAAMPAESRMGPAVLYYLILSIIAAAVGLFWSMILPRPAIDSAGVPTAVSMLRSISPIAGFLLSPVMQIILLFVGAAVTHVMLLILTTQRGTYGRTVRVYCYAYSPCIFAVVPFVGALVGGIWSIVTAIIGLREAHRTTTGRAAMAVLLPLVLIAIAFVVLAMLVLAGAMLMVR